MKERPILFSGEMVRAIFDGRKTQTRRLHKTVGGSIHPENCPYGNPGERLWVRETFRPFFKDGFIYLADAGTHRLNARSEEEAKKNWPGWKPSIHMPRKACRLTLEILSLKVQRLNDISEEDAQAEGAKIEDALEPYRYAFRCLWESINGAGSWEQNPWVWVIEFKKERAK